MARAATSPSALQGGFKESSPTKGFEMVKNELLLLAEKHFRPIMKSDFILPTLNIYAATSSIVKQHLVSCRNPFALILRGKKEQ